MSLAAREALNNLISNAEVAEFATHAEDWRMPTPNDPPSQPASKNEACEPAKKNAAPKNKPLKKPLKKSP